MIEKLILSHGLSLTVKCRLSILHLNVLLWVHDMQFSGSQKMLGPANETIKLEKLGNKVTSVGGVCIGADTDISKLNTWIAAL